ncbi:bifunctional enoyl-CoA hydratase/phosphate acetyltransferase [Motiliproteus sp. MSK22-1]|uniref:bifunctional enoyl-CoA hydratase/phosphate acetyltransferase n=1 Tax=Motiliproteus sp. MSK22-1 TaxID=1897630 RepID=UPI00097797E6|nr:bifunctional enoyl-CoA hydratase/phosphate acetyltransferase [Motiliproteus sp. MSK22-1]OMH36574.1 phosphate acetyltransferase [Motiliproteus sp. MSK22-1]
MLSTAPMECPSYLLEKARLLPAVPTAVANAINEVTLTSAKLAFDEGVIEPVLVGDSEQINQLATVIGWDLSDIRIENAVGEAEAAKRAVELVSTGEASSLMKGHIHTDTLLRAVLSRGAGLRTDRRLSHVFHMTIPGTDKPLCITDAVINVAPSVVDKIHIAQNAIDLLHSLGNMNPRMAVLSGTEEVNRSMQSSVDAAELKKLASIGALRGAIVDGPLAFDNAVSQAAADIKGIDSPVAGNADILLVPNLESGNFLFKQMVYFMSATAAGIIMGARVPIILTSRADPPEARLASCALAAIYADYAREQIENTSVA